MLPSLSTSGNQCKKPPHQCNSWWPLQGLLEPLKDWGWCREQAWGGMQGQDTQSSAVFLLLLPSRGWLLQPGEWWQTPWLPAGPPALESAPPTVSPHHWPAKACFKENTKHAAKRYSLTVYFCLKLFHISLYTATEQ